jgi:Epoxide hydrolase N terminus
MSAVSSSTTRRKVLAGSAAVGAAGLLSAHLAVAAKAGDAPPGQPPDEGDSSVGTAKSDAIRPFRFDASDEALADLRQRIAATKWSSRELVPDASQGVQLATIGELARYWQTDYDWRKVDFAAWEQPQVFSEELRAAFKSLRQPT